MARYQRTSPKFWQDPKVRSWGDREKLLAQYLMTCQHRSTEGLFWLPRSYVAADLGWTIEGVSKALGTLSEAGFVAYDDATETVLICKALKYEAPKGDKQLIGAVSRLQDVPPSPLFSLLKDAAEEYAEEFGDYLTEAVQDGRLKDHARASEGVSKGYPPSNSCSSSDSSSTSISPTGSSRPDENGVDPDAESFEHFWAAYPDRDGKKRGKGNALIEWRKLTDDQRRKAYIGARNLAASDDLPKDAERFLRRAKGGKGDYPFDDWQTPARPHRATDDPDWDAIAERLEQEAS